MVNDMDFTNEGNIKYIDALISAHRKQAIADFCLCNAHKYIWRTLDKNGKEDCDKAIWYLNKYKELKYGKEE